MKRVQGEAKDRTSTKTLAHSATRVNFDMNKQLNMNLRKATAKYSRLMAEDAPISQIKTARGMMRGCALAMHAALNAPYDAEAYKLEDIERRAMEEVE